MYKVFEIECQNCKHKFMWIQNPDTQNSYYLYKRKGLDEELISIYCPRCNVEIAIIKENGKGINVNDESIEVAGAIRGL
ncbi:MAG: hypothetical protein SOU16_11015 [Faecalimonas sp.]|nr:hypothetical protein [Faecalimonas sp.]